MIGTTVSHYRILEKLGEGGMGVVYKAQDLKLDRLIALKFLPPEFTRDPDAKQRFVQEAKAASALDHPNICTIHEVDETRDGQLFIAMAHYEGETLHQKIVNRQLSIDDCITFAIQTAEGLQAAHKKGITHRDIKSSNIMVTPEGQVKIMDFGLAKTTGATMLTKSGATVGTVPYMSPEQARGEKVDHRTDIWSLGVVLYEMISGRLPFESPYSEAIVYSILNEEPKPFSLVRSDVPANLETIVRKCLEKNLANRYQHADELIADLRRAKTGELPKVKVSMKAGFRWRNWYVIGGAALVVAILLFIFLPRLTSHSEVISSIAVLPLDNLSRDPEQEYFADGMTEALITDLAKISALRVISRTSVMLYKTRKKTIPEIAKELNVDAIVEGSVQRSGDRVRITAQLLHAPTDRHLWAESYERNLTDVLSLQSEVALAIVKEIRAKITPQEETRLTSAPAINKEVYELYLKGRFYWNKRTEEGMRKAIEYFDQAIEKDPNLALVNAGLADSYIFLGLQEATLGGTPPKESFPKAKAAALKAVEIDETLAEGHTSLAVVKRYYDRDFVGAEREFKRAIELNPNSAYTHLHYAISIVGMGRLDEALAEVKRARELDPLSLAINSTVGWVLYFARQYDLSIEQLKKTLEMDPNFAIAHYRLGLAYQQKERHEEAIAAFQKAVTLSGGGPLAIAALGHAYAVSGRRNEAQKVLAELHELAKQRYVAAFYFAAIYAGIGEKDQAFAWLEKAYEERSESLLRLNYDPRFNSLRADPRFKELLKKIELPAGAAVDENKASTSTNWQNSIAVLPFKNISSDKEQEYFCDGMTEAIITDLAKIADLVVMSPAAVSRYKGQSVGPANVAEQLRVRYVVEGGVQRMGNALRVSAQLTDAETGVQLWADRFDRTTRDVFTVQDDISQKIVSALQIKLSTKEQQRLTLRPTQNLEAYDLYLRGCYYSNQRSFEGTDRAIPLLERATITDPNFAAAFAMLGSTYAQKAFYDEPLKKDWDQKAYVAVEKALSIDPNLAEAHVAKGNLLWTPTNRFPHDKAIAAYKRAIELKPSYDEAHAWLGFVCYHIGLLEEGLKECRKALQINPNSAFPQSRVGTALLYLGRNEEALTELRKVPAGFNPQVVPMQIAITLMYLGRNDEAEEVLLETEKDIPDDPFLLSTQALLLALDGKHQEAMQKIRLAEQKEKTYLGHFHHAAYNIGSAYALMKENENAVKWLQKAADSGFPCYPKFEKDRHLNNLRHEARFISLMEDLKKRWESFKAVL
ncbi:MAG: hypothetical protein HW389_2321 [Bacteroidetes bacterium]|nr:hypothetical protein [Bacteroidota bacterium]